MRVCGTTRLKLRASGRSLQQIKILFSIVEGQMVAGPRTIVIGSIIIILEIFSEPATLYVTHFWRYSRKYFIQ